MPFLRNVTRGRGIPEERLAAVAEHYEQLRGVSPINAAEPGAARRAERRVRRARHRPAAVLGQPQLEALCRRRGAAHARRRRPARAGVRDQRHGVVLGLPPVPRRPRPGPGGRRRRRARTGEAAALLRPPGLHRRQRRRGARGARRAAAGRARRGAAGLHRPLDPGRDERHAPAPRRTGCTPRSTARRARLVAEAVRGAGRRVRPGVAVALRSAGRAVARAGHQRPPARPRRGRHAGRGGEPDRLRLRPRRGVWDLDNEARGHGRATRACTTPARRRPAPIRRSSTAIAELVEERLAGAEPLALGSLGLCGIDCPLGCCPAPSRSVSPAEPPSEPARPARCSRPPGPVAPRWPAAAARRRGRRCRRGRRRRRSGAASARSSTACIRSAWATQRDGPRREAGRQVELLAGPAGVAQRLGDVAHRSRRRRPRPARWPSRGSRWSARTGRRRPRRGRPGPGRRRTPCHSTVGRRAARGVVDDRRHEAQPSRRTRPRRRRAPRCGTRPAPGRPRTSPAHRQHQPDRAARAAPGDQQPRSAVTSPSGPASPATRCGASRPAVAAQHLVGRGPAVEPGRRPGGQRTGAQSSHPHQARAAPGVSGPARPRPAPRVSRSCVTTTTSWRIRRRAAAGAGGARRARPGRRDAPTARSAARSSSWARPSTAARSATR